jgi:hypothetical protein
MTWVMHEVIGHGPLADIRLMVLFVTLSILAFLPSRLLIYAWMKKVNLQSTLFSPTAASALLTVLLVSVFYIILFSYPHNSIMSTFAGLSLSTILFAPLVVLLTPLFVLYLVCANGAVHQEEVPSRLFIYVAIVVCLILQFLWLGTFLSSRQLGE